jgi:hypothetical protein
MTTEKTTISDVLLAALVYVNTRIADNEKTGRWEIIDEHYDHAVVAEALRAANAAAHVLKKTSTQG